MGVDEMRKKKGQEKSALPANKHSNTSTGNNKKPYGVGVYHYYPFYHNIINNLNNRSDRNKKQPRRSTLRCFWLHELASCNRQVTATISTWQVPAHTKRMLIKTFTNASKWLSSMTIRERRNRQTKSELKGYLYEGVNSSFLSQHFLVQWPGFRSVNHWLECNGKGAPDIKVVYRHHWLTIECKFRSNPFYYFSQKELNQVMDADVVALTFMPINKEVQSCYYVLTSAPDKSNVASYLSWCKGIMDHNLHAYRAIIPYLTSQNKC